jgi:hypothetical protein
MAKKATRKKAAKRTDPDSGKSVPDGQLGDWGLDVPDEIRELAGLYDKVATAKTKASGKYNTAKSNLIEAMKDAGVERCPVREGKKVLVATQTDGIKYEKPADDEEED